MSLTTVTKVDFREKLKVVRRAFTTDPGSMGGLSRALFELLERLHPQRLGTYSPIYGEPDLSALLVEWATLNGCEIYWPTMTAESMVYRRWTPGAELQKDVFGIDSPMVSALQRTPDVVLIPCLGHDKKGHRLGYGKGCFDRYLSRHPEVVTIGLSFEGLIVPEMIFEDHDQSMNFIVTEEGISKI